MSDLLTERTELKAHLVDLETFLIGKAYKGWQAARLAALKQIEEDIIENPLTSRELELALGKDKGKRELLLDLATQFQDVLSTLKDRLDEIEELLQPKEANKETNDN